jgi:endonuclease G
MISLRVACYVENIYDSTKLKSPSVMKPFNTYHCDSHPLSGHVNMRKIFLTPVLLFFALFAAIGQSAPPIADLEIPSLRLSEQIIRHTGFSLLYNESHEQASWVAYELTKEKTVKLYNRTDKFLSDPRVRTGSATAADYKGSGYDRGHLAPAADMGWSRASMEESFYFSNISPQNASFNRGIWKKLEEQVRTWAIAYERIYVVTGPVLQPGLPSIGPNQVSIPRYYYKVILDPAGTDKKGIGFILPNQASKQSLQTYAVSIDSVERLTNLDFFPLLTDREESGIEKTLCLPCWTWSSIAPTAPQRGNIETDDSPSERSQVERDIDLSGRLTVSVQCSGITKAGNRCRRMTKNANGKCFQHQ